MSIKTNLRLCLSSAIFFSAISVYACNKLEFEDNSSYEEILRKENEESGSLNQTTDNIFHLDLREIENDEWKKYLKEDVENVESFNRDDQTDRTPKKNTEFHNVKENSLQKKFFNVGSNGGFLSLAVGSNQTDKAPRKPLKPTEFPNFKEIFLRNIPFKVGSNTGFQSLAVGSDQTDKISRFPQKRKGVVKNLKNTKKNKNIKKHTWTEEELKVLEDLTGRYLKNRNGEIKKDIVERFNNMTKLNLTYNQVYYQFKYIREKNSPK